MKGMEQSISDPGVPSDHCSGPDFGMLCPWWVLSWPSWAARDRFRTLVLSQWHLQFLLPLLGGQLKTMNDTKENRVGLIPWSQIFSPRYTDLFLLGALETQFSTRVGAAMKPKQRICSHSGEITGNPKRSPEHRGCRVRSASDLSADANACWVSALSQKLD
ncbi:hypothetical protein CEXT_179091 [Caerostris extrusa]|uniref:Uncharacterized protein n=1 Tax=Caerostris extrusa TaxID=172846 RepID=A0AAV4RVA2_CAEEX|nr:hypothetical protein CEXT_179091 [Caerostris extrusa]